VPEERRRDKRVKEDFSVLCKVFRTVELVANISRIIDISRRGVCFLTDHPLAKDDIVQMIFRIPPDFKERVELYGRIVESTRETEKTFRTRVAFIEIEPDVHIILNRIIEQALAKESRKIRN